MNHSKSRTSGSVTWSIGPQPGSEIADLYDAVAADPAWSDPEGLVIVALLQPGENPLCIAADGERVPPGTEKLDDEWGHAHFRDGQHVGCCCWLQPFVWASVPMRHPDGHLVPLKRLADGDSGEEVIPFSVTAEEWLRNNPKTFTALFGEEIAAAFFGAHVAGLPPLPPITLKMAAARYKAERDQEEKERLEDEERARQAKEAAKRARADERERRAAEKARRAAEKTSRKP